MEQGTVPVFGAEPPSLFQTEYCQVRYMSLAIYGLAITNFQSIKFSPVQWPWTVILNATTWWCTAAA